jgi:hypothetical protein
MKNEGGRMKEVIGKEGKMKEERRWRKTVVE